MEGPEDTIYFIFQTFNISTNSSIPSMVNHNLPRYHGINEVSNELPEQYCEWK